MHSTVDGIRIPCKCHQVGLSSSLASEEFSPQGCVCLPYGASCVKIGSPGLAGTGPSAETGVFPKFPLCHLGTSQQELTKVLIGAGISTRWFMGHHDCFFLKVRSPWPSSRGRAMGLLYCSRQSSAPSGTGGTSNWLGDSWCLQWKKKGNLVLGLGPHKRSYNVSLPVKACNYD